MLSCRPRLFASVNAVLPTIPVPPASAVYSLSLGLWIVVFLLFIHETQSDFICLYDKKHLHVCVLLRSVFLVLSMLISLRVFFDQENRNALSFYCFIYGIKLQHFPMSIGNTLRHKYIVTIVLKWGNCKSNRARNEYNNAFELSKLQCLSLSANTENPRYCSPFGILDSTRHSHLSG